MDILSSFTGIYGIILMAVIGLVIGSFSNVCILRIPANEPYINSRSHCMNCEQTLKWYDMIPLISYIILKGRCRYCGEKISKQYPLIELTNCIAYILIITIKGFSIDSVLICLTFTTLLITAIIDERNLIIPIECSTAILFIGIISVLLNKEDATNRLCGIGAMTIILGSLYILTKGKGIGGGDFKLLAAVGLLLGFEKSILVLLLSSVLALIVHPIKMKTKKEGHKLAFGPYIAIAVIIVLLFGESIWEQYYNIATIMNLT